MHGNLPDLLIVRHGETEWNRMGRLQGDLDSPLTDLGRDQATAIGQCLASLGVTPQSHDLYASPLGRARDTARLINAAARPLDWLTIEDARLREISVGDWTGLARSEILDRHGLGDDLDFLEFYRSVPGGETLTSVADRVDRFLAGLRGPAVVVTHGVTSLILRTRALGWDLDRAVELPGGQGVIHRISKGQHTEITP